MVRLSCICCPYLALTSGAGYIYTPDDPAAAQTFLPDALLGQAFLENCPNPFRK